MPKKTRRKIPSTVKTADMKTQNYRVVYYLMIALSSTLFIFLFPTLFNGNQSFVLSFLLILTLFFTFVYSFSGLVRIRVFEDIDKKTKAGLYRDIEQFSLKVRRYGSSKLLLIFLVFYLVAFAAASYIVVITKNANYGVVSYVVLTFIAVWLFDSRYIRRF